MSLQAPVADMITSIRNGQMAKLSEVIVPHSALKLSVLKVLKEEGFILDYRVQASAEQKNVSTIVIALKYFENKPVIEVIKCVSTPGLRVYKKCKKLPKIRGGLGVAIISTPKGVVSDRVARSLGQGGVVLCYVA